MSIADVKPEERARLLARYFEPATEGQYQAVESWLRAVADSIDDRLDTAYRRIDDEKTSPIVIPAWPYGRAWFEEMHDWRAYKPANNYLALVASAGILRPYPWQPAWATGLWEWSAVQSRVGDALPTPRRYWHLPQGGLLRSVGEKLSGRRRLDRRPWGAHESPGGNGAPPSGSEIVQWYLDGELMRRWPVASVEQDRLVLVDLSDSAGREVTLQRLPAHVSIVPGAPRSGYEVDYYVAGTRCHACGGVGLGRSVPMYAAGEVKGFCGSCNAVREFRFAPVVSAGPIDAFHLAPGAEPSTVYDAAELRAEADAALATVSRQPGDYGTVAEYTEARRRLVRGLTALVELGKFAPSDGALAEERAAVEALYDGYDAAKRTVASRPGAQPVARGIEDRLRQHRAWLERGGAGDGRLVMRGETYRGGGFDYARWARVQIEGSRFEGVDLRHADLTEAELTNAQLVDCRIGWSQWRRTKVTGCELRGSGLSLARFDGTEVRGGDWRGVRADRSEWSAMFAGVDLREADLSDGMWTQTTFTGCDLRGAKLGRSDLQLSLGQHTGTRFIDCDLRGADLSEAKLIGVHFERCKLAGVVGTPRPTPTTTLTACDLSPDGDGRVGGADQLLALWRARANR